MRKIETTLENILSLIYVADDYGWNKNILMDAFAEMLGYKLSFEEIEIEAQSILKEKGYGQEDYEHIKSKLTEFKEEFCTK